MALAVWNFNCSTHLLRNFMCRCTIQRQIVIWVVRRVIITCGILAIKFPLGICFEIYYLHNLHKWHLIFFYVWREKRRYSTDLRSFHTWKVQRSEPNQMCTQTHRLRSRTHTAAYIELFNTIAHIRVRIIFALHRCMLCGLSYWVWMWIAIARFMSQSPGWKASMAQNIRCRLAYKAGAREIEREKKSLIGIHWWIHDFCLMRLLEIFEIISTNNNWIGLKNIFNEMKTKYWRTNERFFFWNFWIISLLVKANAKD